MMKTYATNSGGVGCILGDFILVHFAVLSIVCGLNVVRLRHHGNHMVTSLCAVLASLVAAIALVDWVA